MTRALWMPGVHHKDLTDRPGGAGYRVAGWVPKGVVLHVNDSPIGSYGTSIDWYAAGGGADNVCPTWQVYPDGVAWQLLPASVQPWCQAAGNQWGLAIETGGNHAEPLTPAALAACGAIMRWVHDEWGIPLQITDTPARPGLGTHQMGGAAWGGHPCPGSIRAAQRSDILDIAQGGAMQPKDVWSYRSSYTRDDGKTVNWWALSFLQWAYNHALMARSYAAENNKLLKQILANQKAGK